MHRVTTFVLLVLLFVNYLAADSRVDEVSKSGDAQNERIRYHDLIKGMTDHTLRQCFYEVFPVFPVNVSAEELVVRELPSPPQDKQNMAGVCFSGGGSRSLTLSAGGYAALLYHGYEPRINYISMVSGGAWGVANYYALSKEFSAKYFGRVIKNFKGLRWKEKEIEERRNIAWLHPYNVGRAAQKLKASGMFWHFLLNFYSQGTKLWSNYLEHALLTPYGLSAEMSFDRSLFSAMPDHMQLIINAGAKDAFGQMVPLEITTAGVGTRAPLNGLGDAYALPPEAFGRSALGIRSKSIWVEAKQEFTLGDIHAVTSSNFVHIMSPLWDMLSTMGIAVPGFNWLNLNMTSGELVQSHIPVVDSGPDEYLGLMPLLVRGMRKIIAFVNTDIPIVKGDSVIGLEKVLPSYFGVIPDEAGKGRGYPVASPGAEGGCGVFCLKNQVFPSDRYQEVAEHLWQAKENGRPIVYLQQNLPVQNNEKYGVEGGGVVDILWVYNDLPNGWFKHLGNDLQEQIAASDLFLCQSEGCSSNGYRFPHYDAMTELTLSPEQVNMLFHLQTWTMLNSRKELETLFNSAN